MTQTTRSRRAALAAVVLACSLSFGLTACSGPSEADTVAETANGVGAKYGACMRDAGFDIQDPDDAALESGAVQAPADADQDAFQKAMRACRKAAGVQGSSNADQQKWARETAKVASCIRDNGYPDFPEQKPGMLDALGYERGREPGFEKALRSCTEEFAPDTQTQELGR
ncbi:hypothetical protein [Curtobacterium sp. PhB115]|uniref:hypothetical protein n=1 Tax=Curtobacterium sp. PhB115 TaxID=2485173 RepID=UPI000F4C5C5D|nr:hypothetical protein [Curtobacterium sp. PhB115]ROP74819.1 hypothetical protein EDF19_0906 [Curtobacterium sp. PhB115]